jgi:hypothetical protein
MPLARTSADSGTGYSRRSGPWEFKTGPDCETITTTVRQARTAGFPWHGRAGSSHTEQLPVPTRTSPKVAGPPGTLLRTGASEPRPRTRRNPLPSRAVLRIKATALRAAAPGRARAGHAAWRPVPPRRAGHVSLHPPRSPIAPSKLGSSPASMACRATVRPRPSCLVIEQAPWLCIAPRVPASAA